MKITIAIAVLLAALVGCGSAQTRTQPPPAEGTVTLSVVAEGLDAAEIRYTSIGGPSGSRDGVALPWTRTLWDPPDARLSLEASSPVPPGGARLTCLIEVNGGAVARASSTSGDPDDRLSCATQLAAQNVP